MSYGKGKSKVTKKRREDNINSRDNKNNKLLADKKCIGDLNLKKRTIIKEDGRYLIYYDF